MGNCFYQVLRIGAEKFISQCAQPVEGLAENHPTGCPQCIIDCVKTKRAMLSARPQAQNEHLIKGHNPFPFLLEFLSYT